MGGYSFLFKKNIHNIQINLLEFDIMSSDENRLLFNLRLVNFTYMNLSNFFKKIMSKFVQVIIIKDT